MAANGHAQKGQHHPPGYWGKWRGVSCAIDGCDKPAKCKGMCMPHYNKQRWADGVRSPSVNPESRREAHLRHRYGLSRADYDRMLAEQDGFCAVCKRPPSRQNTRAHWNGKLCVDHCHGTTRVRGLLCNDCNLVVGYGRTEEVLLAAAAYLRDRA
jgi:recombination endonuclease VII